MTSLRRAARIKSGGKPLPGLRRLKMASAFRSLKLWIIATPIEGVYHDMIQKVNDGVDHAGFTLLRPTPLLGAASAGPTRGRGRRSPPGSGRCRGRLSR